jgi:hypothetical protein
LVQRTARTGISARGLIYLVLSAITMDIALTGGGGPRDSSTGAIQEMLRQPAGPVLVIVLAGGLAAYAVWRLLQAGSGDADADGAEDWFKRIGWAAIGVLYAGLSGRAVLYVLGGSEKQKGAPTYTSKLISYPGGRILLVLVGLGVVAGGVGLAVWAVLQKFQNYLPDRRVPSWADIAARVTITYGNLARGLVFAAVGASLAIAGLSGKSKDAKDFDQILHSLAHLSYGPLLLVLAALGFLAFACASGLEAAYREL